MSRSRPTPSPHAQDASLPAIRLHVEAPLDAGAEVPTTPAQAHYLVNVMRREPGERVRLFNGRDGEHQATIGELKRDRCLLKVGPLLRPQAPEANLWLAFALLKRGPTELVVQKATELGVAVIVPLFTTRTNADRTNLERLRLIAIEAAEQSERLSIPLLHPPRALNALLTAWPSERRLAACLERSDDPPIRPRPGVPRGLLIGPEGGFTEPELDAVRGCAFVEPASLGPRILRAETAAIVGLALLQAV